MTRRPSILRARTALGHRFLLPLPLLAVPLSGWSAHAQQPTRAGLRAEALRLQATVRECAAAAGACDAGSVPDGEAVQAEGGHPKLTVRWEWLRDALEGARTATPADRQASMQICAARLGEIEREVEGGPDEMAARGFAKTRGIADGILARPEFGAAAPPSAWDRFLARLRRGLERLFAGFGRLGEQAPWLGKALEWTFFLAAAVGLLLFVRRNFQRQRLAGSLRGVEAARSAWDREATDWAALADRAAANAEWREAVHCVYWAAIVRLEGRRAWRHNPARTPRECVRLLLPGSPQRESLGGLTGLLERVWYGLRPAGAEDYERARAWFERLSEPALASAGRTAELAGSERA